MPDTANHWAELLDPALREAFYIGFGTAGPVRRTSLIPVVFDVVGSDRADETHQGVGVLSSDQWNEFEKTGRVPYDDTNKGFDKTFTHEEFAKGITVQRRLIDDNKSQIAFARADRLGDSAFRKREKDGASVFNNAFTAGAYAGPDSVALCSASHPVSAEDSSTWSNTGTSALSADSLSSTRVAMMRFEDDRGDIMDVMPDQLLVPPELEDTAIPLTGSVLDPTSANNAVNPIPGRFQTIVWHYLTDTNNWFMLEAKRRQQSLKWYNRIPLEFQLERDFETYQAKWAGYMRYSFGWTDPAWVYGHSVS